jgi:DNA-binding GntR family transcriptional regulator
MESGEGTRSDGDFLAADLAAASGFRGPRRLRQNLKDDISSLIAEDILSGRIRPGSRVNQDELCKRFGVSRLPVREALIMLENSGFIRNQPRLGSYVSELGPDDVRDHYALFGVASGLAAQYAVDTLTDTQLAELDTVLDELHRAPDRHQAVTLNFVFHRRINKCGSRRLQAHIRGMARVIPASLFAGTEWGPHSESDHQRILRALVARDRAAAFAATDAHLRNAGERAVQMLTDAGFWDTSGQRGRVPAGRDVVTEEGGGAP